jgi:hypothetical protein
MITHSGPRVFFNFVFYKYHYLLALDLDLDSSVAGARSTDVMLVSVEPFIGYRRNGSRERTAY